MVWGDSELARRMRAVDWAHTPVGPPESWPESLRGALTICLTSRFPLQIWWGRELTLFYNDGYAAFLGPKHPAALGRPGREVWAEIWHELGPMIDAVFATGVASWAEDQPMFFARALPAEEVYVTFSLSPVLGGDGRTVEGLFGAWTESTDKIVGARRLDTLRELGMTAAIRHSTDEAARAAADVLSRNPCDVPFAALYLLDAGVAHRTCAVGIAPEQLPAAVAAGDDDAWGVAHVLRSHRGGERALTGVTGGPWRDPLTTALALPLRIHDAVAGVLVAGASARRPLDAAYRTFFDLVAGHISSALALAELDRAKTAFFANVSHELRTPLTLILGPLEEVLARGGDPATRTRVEMAHRSALRMQKLVNALLDYSRMEAGGVRAAFAPHDLAAETADLASSFRSAIEAAGLRFIVDCPPLARPVWVDRDMWEMIVLNLLSNAFKFTFEGEIAISLHAAGDTARLTVRDTGTGVAPDELPRLFERFHRIAGQRSRTPEGSGIGLALVHEIVRMHGGEITATSEQYRGTSFTVAIPIGPKTAVAAAPASPDPVRASAYVAEASAWAGEPIQAPVARGDGLRARVLFADDNADMREYVTDLLSPEWDVTVAADGSDALAHALREPPDLVLTDVMMPGLDGFGLLRRLREEQATRHIPVVMVSARAGEESRVEGLNAGADDYIVKPFSARELRARVRSNLSSRGSR